MNLQKYRDQGCIEATGVGELKQEQPLDISRVTQSFAKCLVQNQCTSDQLIFAANVLLDQAIAQMQDKLS